MRGFREIRNREIREVRKDKKEEGYKKIKPETVITIDQARAFWDDLFSRPIEEKE